MTDEDKSSLLNDLIDFRCSIYGIFNTIQWLVNRGLSRADILELEFDAADIDYVLENEIKIGEEVNE